MSSAAGTRCLCCLRWSPVLTLMSIAVLVSSVLFSINTAVGLVHPFFFLKLLFPPQWLTSLSPGQIMKCVSVSHTGSREVLQTEARVIIWQRYCCGVLLFLWLSHNQGSTLRGHEGDGAMIWKILLQTNLYLYQMYVAGVFPLSQSTVGGGRGEGGGRKENMQRLARLESGEWTCTVTQCTHPAFWLRAQSPPRYIYTHTGTDKLMAQLDILVRVVNTCLI